MGLSRECRFNGYTKKWWSVADHSLWCADKAEEMKLPSVVCLSVLMHDAHEAYLWDAPTPSISAIDETWYNGSGRYKDDWNAIKDKCQHEIGRRFAIDEVQIYYMDAIKIIDKQALEWEWGNKVKKWTGMPPLSTESAALLFIEKFKQYCKIPHVIWPNTEMKLQNLSG